VKPVVLVVEDDADSRNSLRELLELDGYQVETAGDGREALDKLHGLAGEPCVVMLLDLYMPVMDGWRVIDELRASNRMDRIKVIVTTSAPHQAPSGVPVLAKPLRPPQLLHAIAVAC
jgi:CheY-like chemotaxis protein